MGSNEQTTTSSGWDVAMGHGENILGQANSIYNQMMGQNVPQMGQVQINPMLQGAWNQMSSGNMTDLAQQMGTVGHQMMAGMGQLGSLYDQIGQGPNMYNQQNYRDTMLADREGYLSEVNAGMMKDLEKATAQSTGQIYGAAAGGGNVGSSRTQLASGQAAGNLAAQTQSTMANIYNQAFDTASNQAAQQESQRLAALQAQASGILQQGQMGANMMGQAGNIYQQGLNNMLQAGTGQMAVDQQNALINYQNAQNAYNKPMQLLGWYNSQVSPWVGAQTTNTQVTNSNPLGMIGQIGGSLMSGMGGSLGSSIGGKLF